MYIMSVYLVPLVYILSVMAMRSYNSQEHPRSCYVGMLGVHVSRRMVLQNN